jgi:hypothetical protein
MYELNNGKRSFAAEIDHGVKLKKQCTVAYGTITNTQLSDICGHSGFSEQGEAGLLSQSSCLSPPYPRNTSEDYVSDQIRPLLDDTSLLASADYNSSDESALQTNLWSMDGLESLKEELSPENNNVVPRVCFGVVSYSKLFRGTTTNTISLS